MATVEGGDHRVRYVNPAFCRLMGKSRKELIGRPFAEILPEKDGCLELVDRVYRTGEPENRIEPDRSAPDSLYWSYTIWPVRGADERRVGIMLQVTETTKFHQRSAEMSEALMIGSVRQHELAEALEEAHAQLQLDAGLLETTVAERTAKLRDTVQELESFSYSISHDMRSPLRAMQGFAKILDEECHDQLGQSGHEYIRRIIDAANRMDQLIQDILNFSRIARSELPLRPVNVDRLARDILQTYPNLEAPKADIEIQGTLPPVLGNEAALTQCIANLLGNAVKFMAPGVKPQVRIWAEQSEGGVRLFFRDNGIGIPPKAREKIFSIFQRLSSDYEGTGIGLSIVKKAVERMGGKVGLDSEVGKGSTFWLQLQQADLKEGGGSNAD
jgi:PAS domain S-box-containing protein